MAWVWTSYLQLEHEFCYYGDDMLDILREKEMASAWMGQE